VFPVADLNFGVVSLAETWIEMKYVKMIAIIRKSRLPCGDVD